MSTTSRLTTTRVLLQVLDGMHPPNNKGIAADLLLGSDSRQLAALLATTALAVVRGPALRGS
jgi:hypothetical protein